mgnify:CR=1 FL=1
MKDFIQQKKTSELITYGPDGTFSNRKCRHYPDMSSNLYLPIEGKLIVHLDCSEAETIPHWILINVKAFSVMLVMVLP